MLTAENEGGQLKAHNYWSDKHYGPTLLKFLGEHRASLEPSRIQRYREGSRDNRPSFTRRRSTNPAPGARNAPPPPQPVAESPNSEHPYVIVRRFTLSRADEPFERMREITQLQYTNWPDFGAPAHPAHLLGLVEQCDAVVRASYGGSPSAFTSHATQRPVLVHCSAGCGRTGTFCTVDSVIDMLKQQQKETFKRSVRQPTPMDIELSPSRSGFVFGQSQQNDSGFFTKVVPTECWLLRDDLDLIEKTVEEFRHQRLSAVQSLRQFVLCYETVLEWLAEQTPKSA
jgi:tyrosine-protein phosphatase 2/3